MRHRRVLQAGWNSRLTIPNFFHSVENGPTHASRVGQWIEFCGLKTSTRRVSVELLQQVEGLGRAGDVTSVTPGYARNFLLPNHLARIHIVNDKSVQKRMRGLPFAASVIAEASSFEQDRTSVEPHQEEEQREALRIKKELKKLETIVRKLTETTITHRGRVQGEGVLESPIGPKEITVAVAKQLGIEIAEDLIDMEGDVVDTVGDFLIPLKLILGDEMKAKIQLRVVSS